MVKCPKVDKKGNWLDSLPWLDRPSDTLDFTLRRHVIEISGEVGEEKVRFGLDTGAEINLLDRGVKQEAMQHFKIFKRVLLNGTGSEATEVLAGKLYKVRCGPKYCSGMRTLVTSMDDINAVYGTRLDGLLGFEFICVHRFSINYQKEKMFFYPVFPESSP